jgi:hypothetical protein
MINKVPTSYFLHDCCANCKHVLCIDEDDMFNINQYYCHFDKSDRPKCGSLIINEELLSEEEQELNEDLLIEIYGKKIDVWEEWANSHRVEQSGCCDNWEPISEIKEEE